MRERLVERIRAGLHKHECTIEDYVIPTWEYLADYILADGWMRVPCEVGQTVYYFSHSPLNLSVQPNTVYEATVVRIVTTGLGTSLVIQIHNECGCTEIPDIHKWNEEVFPTREEAVKALKGGAE